MQESSSQHQVRHACALALCVVASFVAAKSASAAAAAPPALTPYTTADQSASAGVPQGWQVTKGEFGVIMMSGPHGEQVALGAGIFVHNGPPGSPVAPPIKASMPASAKLGQKYLMLWQQAAASSGEPDPQMKVISARRIAIAPAVGECGVVMGSMTKNGGPQKFETQFCSLRPDSGGVFKLIWNHATIPDAFVGRERTTVEAVLHSYRPSQATIRLWMQPLTPQMPAMPRGTGAVPVGGGMSSTYWGQIGADHSAECMDLGVIREEPIWRLPPYCH